MHIYFVSRKILLNILSCRMWKSGTRVNLLLFYSMHVIELSGLVLVMIRM